MKLRRAQVIHRLADNQAIGRLVEKALQNEPLQSISRILTKRIDLDRRLLEQLSWVLKVRAYDECVNVIN